MDPIQQPATASIDAAVRARRGRQPPGRRSRTAAPVASPGRPEPVAAERPAVEPPVAPHGPDALDLPLKLLIARLAHGISPASLAQAQADWLVHLLVSPSRQLALGASAVQKSVALTQYLLRAAQGCHEDCITPAPQDKRFSRPEWQALPYGALAQGFLLLQQWWAEATEGVRGVSRHHTDVTAFAIRQWLDTWSPSNFVVTNPQVLGETINTGGANLMTGMANWWRDAVLVASDARPRGVEAFKPGQTVATTRGRVVMRNHLIELIEYAPTTDQVHKEVVLIIPSWIMKFYILDLTPESSLVKYLVDQGHTVLMVSWRNPGAEDAHLGLDDYLHFGVFDAFKATRHLHPGRDVNAMGYCLGGTLLAMAAAILCTQGESALKSVTLLAAQVDFREPGELGLFVDESQIAFLEDVMAEHGYLDGRQMAGAFQLINSKDLVWSKLIHEYLMGAHSPMTALRAWNADSTRMPARMHSEYLRRLYLHNDLAEGRYRVHGQPVLLDEIRVPMFLVATERDHVSPWRSVYEILRLARAPATLVLTSGGHNVGVVNPPSGPDAHPGAYYLHAAHAARQAPTDPQRWLEHAHREPGSWWPAWERWLHKHSSGLIAAVPLEGKVGGEVVPAPGSYVHQL